MKRIVSMLSLAGLLALPSVASERAGVDQIIAKAQTIETEAAELARHLKLKNPDLAKVNERVAWMRQEAAALQTMVASFEDNASGLTPEQQKHLSLVKDLAALVNVFVENKRGLLDSADAGKNRKMLQAKADGIAKRSDLLQQAASRLRG